MEGNNWQLRTLFLTSSSSRFSPTRNRRLSHSPFFSWTAHCHSCTLIPLRSWDRVLATNPTSQCSILWLPNLLASSARAVSWVRRFGKHSRHRTMFPVSHPTHRLPSEGTCMFCRWLASWSWSSMRWWRSFRIAISGMLLHWSEVVVESRQ